MQSLAANSAREQRGKVRVKPLQALFTGFFTSPRMPGREAARNHAALCGCVFTALFRARIAANDSSLAFASGWRSTMADREFTSPIPRTAEVPFTMFQCRGQVGMHRAEVAGPRQAGGTTIISTLQERPLEALLQRRGVPGRDGQGRRHGRTLGRDCALARGARAAGRI